MSKQTDGPIVTGWLGEHVMHTKGRWAGNPFVLEPWETEFVNELFRYRPDGRRVYQEGLLGVPRKNGKTTIVSGLGLYFVSADGEQSPEVYAAAGSRDQASVIFRQAKDSVDASPKLRDALDPRQYFIGCPSNRGIFRVIPSDAKLQHGSNPSAVLIDELWAHKNSDLYTALTTGTGARQDPMAVTITTAGYDKKSALGEMYDRALALPDLDKSEFLTVGRDEENGFLFWWYGPGDGADLEDPRVWKGCNPASWITEDYLRREYHKPSMRLNDFLRFHLNQWTGAEDAWLPAGAWDECKDEEIAIPDGAPVWLGVDVGLKHDCSAVGVAYKRDDGKVPLRARIFKPKGDGTPLDLIEVENEIRSLATRYSVRGVGYDKWSFERSAQILSDEGLNMVEFSMANERIVPASARLYEAITTKRVVHDGDLELAAHVAAGATRDTERGWRIAKGKAKRSMDALSAILIAFSLADTVSESVYERRDLLVL